jgi:DNA modification methylase
MISVGEHIDGSTRTRVHDEQIGNTIQHRDVCPKCGAKRIDAQLGAEKTPEAYVENMVMVFREVRRILRDDGTVWLNLGDSYARNGGGVESKMNSIDKMGVGQKATYLAGAMQTINKVPFGLKSKDLVGIPWRVALALQADGWWLRQDIIWHKPNPMPESVEDRCTKAHEYIFMLSKKAHYYYDHEASKEDAVGAPHSPGNKNVTQPKEKGARDPALDPDRVWASDGKKNKRSVWTVNTKGYKGAHFAVYPKKLIEPCILAGTSKYGCCSKCGAPYEQVVNHTGNPAGILGHKGVPNTANTAGSSGKKGKPVVHTETGVRLKKGHNPTQYSKSEPTDEWIPTCNCKDTDVVPCTVLDPFTGSGTTAIVALENNRNFVGTELNPEYIQLAENRIKEEIPITLASVLE